MEEVGAEAEVGIAEREKEVGGSGIEMIGE